MKKFISFNLTLLFVLCFGAITAHAQAVFNSPGSMPTIAITNATTNPCTQGSIDGCWKTSTTANSGDIISVQVYYKNTSSTTAQGTSLHIEPKNSGAVSSLTFTGGVGSLSGPAATGSAQVTINGGSQTLTFIEGSGRWYKNDQPGKYGISSNALFGDGLSIGAIAPGQQGVVAVDFKVSGTVNDDECYINSFTADDYNIEDGDDTDLNWSTTGCDYVDISSSEENFSNRNPDSSVSVRPNEDTTYTLRAYPGGDSATVRIYVDEDNDNNGESCSIDEFEADDTSIDRADEAELTWRTSGDVDYVTLSGFGTVSDDGSREVSPYSTTTYTLRAYCGDGDDDTDSVTIYVSQGQISTQPQAITTVATVLSSTTARLNGIAVPNTTNSTTYAWFEWGPYATFGYTTAKQTIASSTSTYYSDVLQGLVPGGAYYYRAVVQNQNGIAYGSPVRFQTSGAVASTTTVVKYVPQTITTGIVAKSAPSLLELKVQSAYDHMCAMGEIEYTVTYRNISQTQTLEGAVLRIALPAEMDYLAGSGGSYSVIDKTLTVPLGNIPPAAQGSVQLRARVNNVAVAGNLAVTTATVVYTNTVTHAQEDAIAYSLVTITNECPNLLGASVFGLSFLPHTLLGWLLLILVILALIVLGRQMYKKAPTA